MNGTFDFPPDTDYLTSSILQSEIKTLKFRDLIPTFDLSGPGEFILPREINRAQGIIQGWHLDEVLDCRLLTVWVELRDVGRAGLLHHRGEGGGRPAQEAVPHWRAAPPPAPSPPTLRPVGGDEAGVVQELEAVRLISELPASSRVAGHGSHGSVQFKQIFEISITKKTLMKKLVDYVIVIVV